MKIILSRKGFDSNLGGVPSPIFPDGRMLSLPIPDKQSHIRYRDIRWDEYDLGEIVSDLTKNRIPGSHFAHLDPDVNPDSLARNESWAPLFGQTGTAQGHLRNNGVTIGDIFLFFGLFRAVLIKENRLELVPASPARHVIWGWFQIGDIVKVDDVDPKEYEWARYHPHFHRSREKNNTIYVARKYLRLPGVSSKKSGAGAFKRFSETLQLTGPTATSWTVWELPEWFFPKEGRRPLSYHGNMSRWRTSKNRAILNSVSRGQEFVLEGDDYPEITTWISDLLAA